MCLQDFDEAFPDKKISNPNVGRKTKYKKYVEDNKIYFHIDPLSFLPLSLQMKCNLFLDSQPHANAYIFSK